MRESQQIAAEHQDLAAHAHRSGAEQHGKEDHLTGSENSRRNLEHSNQTYLHSQEEQQWKVTEQGVGGFSDAVTTKDVAILAYEFWQARGCPEGSPDEDWFHAMRVLRSRP